LTTPEPGFPVSVTPRHRAAAHTLTLPAEWPLWRQYVLALAFMAAALVGRWLVEAELGQRGLFLTYFACLLPLALLVRPGPFLMAAVVGFTSAWLVFIPPRMSLAIHESTEGVLLAIFGLTLATTVLTSWLSHRGRAQRQRDRNALRKSEQRLRLLTDAAPALISNIGRDMRFRMNNKAYETWFGRTGDDFHGKHLREVLGSAAFERVRPYAEAALSGRHAEFEMELPYRNGETRFVQGHYVPEIEQDGAITGFYALVTDISARNRAEQEVLRRNEQFEALLKAVPVGIYLVDADFRIQLVNPMAEPVFGQFDGGVVGRDFGEVVHMIWPAAYADEVVRIFRHTLETGEPYHRPELAETRIDLGLIEYYEWHVARIMLPDGRYGVVCYFRDVSEQVNARLAISRSEARYRALFESIDEGFCILQVIFDAADQPIDYRYLETNPAFVKQTGLNNAVGRTIRQLVPDIEPSWIRIYGKVALTGEPTRLEEHARSMGRWFDVYAFRVGEAAERRVAVLFTDITQRKQAQESMARQLRDHKRLQAISSRLIPADDVRTLYAELVDAAVELTQANRGTIQSIDRETGELCLLEARGIPEPLRNIAARVPPDAPTSCAEALRQRQRVIVDYLADERIAGTPAARAHIEAGIRVAQSTPLVTRAGRLVGMISTHWDQPHEIPQRALYLLDVLARQSADLIERAQAEETLREADRRKDEFLATLAHELRNPLAGIRMASAVIDCMPEDTARVTEMTTIIERQTVQLVRLIDDLLDVSRISRGKMTLRQSRIDVCVLVRQLVADLRGACEAKGLVAAAEVPPQPVMIDGDPVRIAQVVNNLLQNACEFTPSGGSIRVTVAQSDGEVAISVADTGIGMSPQYLRQVFEMFAQADQPPSHRAGGLGIGLSLAKSIVEMHGGQIEAHSEGPGKGCEFRVRLRAAERDASDGESDADRDDGTAPARRPAGLRILVADDNSDALQALALMLRMKGYEVLTASDGVDAFRKAKERAPDVALLDIGMPGLDGHEVARRIRQQPWGKDLLLVALTGWGQDRDRDQAHEAGFDLHQTKPVDADTLDELIGTWGQQEIGVRDAFRMGEKLGSEKLGSEKLGSETNFG
jgi:PAS domain S-box-containing protein